MPTSRIRYRVFVLITLTISLLNIQKTRAQQEFIVVEKTLKNKQIIYSSGDKISFKLKDENFFRTDHIVALNDSSIEFHYNNILYDEITEINIRGKRFSSFNVQSVGTYAQIAGIAYIAIDQFNQVVVRGEDASFNDGVWLAGGLVFLGGTIIKMLSPKKVKLGGKYKIRYMNLKSN